MNRLLILPILLLLGACHVDVTLILPNGETKAIDYRGGSDGYLIIDDVKYPGQLVDGERAIYGLSNGGDIKMACAIFDNKTKDCTELVVYHSDIPNIIPTGTIVEIETHGSH